MTTTTQEPALAGLIANARRTALRRKQRTSTAHALLVMLQQDPETSTLLTARGVREGELLSALKVVDPEPASAIEVACERAARLAATAGEPSARAIHLLAAIVREPRTAGHRCLESSGVSTSRLGADVGARLQIEDDPSLSRTTTAPKAAVRPTPPAPDWRVTSRPESRPETRLVPPVPRTKLPQERADEPRAQATPPALRHGDVPPVRRRPSASARPLTMSPSAPPVLGPHDLDPERYPLLSRIGRNLTAAAAAGRIDPVVGREHELDRLLDVLGRRRANNPVLVGPPGVGKTALVEGLALRLLAVPEGAPLHASILVEVGAGALVSGTGVRGALAERLKQLRDEVLRAEGRLLLFLDEIHAIVGEGGPDELANELKASLARGELPCIGATTDAEYRRGFERDAALARRFSRIDVGEPSPSDAVEILRSIAPSYERHHAVAYDPAAIRASVELTVRYVPEGFLPDKAIAVLDLAAARARRRGTRVVDAAQVARVVAEQAHVPLDRLLMRDADRLLRLEQHLCERVVGQREPLARVADALRKGAAGFRGRRPLGTFLLLGPTGVGKTETAKAIAELLFPGSGLTRFDMSELSESHAVARLLGAPPGYVGHEDGGQLTETVRRRPYQLILLDEIEKAHPEVLLSLLPLLDEGRLTDGRGRTVDFTNTVIVMTSNLGASSALSVRRAVGFGGAGEAPVDRKDAVLAAARRALPPELYNRIDEPLFFAPLGRDEVASIARLQLEGVAAVMRREHQVAIEIEPSVIDALIAAGGFDPELGARPMRRTIGRLVEAKLAERVLAGTLGRGRTIVLRGEGALVELDVRPEVAAAE